MDFLGMALIQYNMTWDNLIAEFKDFDFGSFEKLTSFLKRERRLGKEIYPKQTEIFKALELTPFESVKVVILGQDPYYNPGQAQGLAFSVAKDVIVPPSLQNIFKELKKDLGIDPSTHGDLTKWAKNGVLLLNSILTVEKGLPLSHENKGWEKLTMFLLDRLARDGNPKVFLLWGVKANSILKNQKFHENCLVLRCGHPSPLSYRFFMNNNHFSIANSFLKSKGVLPVNWNLNEEV